MKILNNKKKFALKIKNLQKYLMILNIKNNKVILKD